MLVSSPQAISFQELFRLGLAARGKIRRIYLHWSAGRYGQVFDDYHLNIDADGRVYQTCRSLTESKSHTYKRNSASIGISLCCCFDAVCFSSGRVELGSQPPRPKQIEAMARAVAVLSVALKLPISFETVTTHAEAACMDGYGIGSDDGDMRWDLLLLPDLPITRTMRPGGVVLRGKALWYLEHFRKQAQAKFKEEV